MSVEELAPENMSPFVITEHILPCSYIKEYPRTTSAGREQLQIAIKQYTPRDNLLPRDGDLTIIAAHGAGLPKELYEPLWESLHRRSGESEFRIRSIWIADSAYQGVSGVLNEDKLGNDVSWFDHSHDLLAMINHFREQMPQPLIGIGHSLGSVQLIHLSLLHPRLLTSLIVLEPVMGKSVEDCEGTSFVRQLAPAPDTWNSMDEALAFAKRIYRNWDPRVFNRWVKYGYRQLPTSLYRELPNSTSTASRPVALTTSKHNVLCTYLRPNFNGFIGNVTEIGSVPFTGGLKESERAKEPKDINIFFPYEPIKTFNDLTHLRPHVLYIFGDRSPVSKPLYRKEKVERTGTGLGGSGGAAVGNVKEVVIQKAGHLVVMEQVEKCADAAASWIQDEMRSWIKEQKHMNEWRIQNRQACPRFSDEQLNFIRTKL